MLREEQFEKMLADVRTEYENTVSRLEEMKKDGKQKTAAYRELVGKKLLYQQLMTMYRIYGLIE